MSMANSRAAIYRYIETHRGEHIEKLGMDHFPVEIGLHRC